MQNRDGQKQSKRKIDDNPSPSAKRVKQDVEQEFFKWDFEQVGQFLKDIKMDMYVEKFKENAVDGEVLRFLNHETARDLVKSFHVPKLLARIKSLWEEEPQNQSIPKPSPPASPAALPPQNADRVKVVPKRRTLSITPPQAPKNVNTDRWEFQDETGKWIEYPSHMNKILQKIEDAVAMKITKAANIPIVNYHSPNGKTYKILFDCKKQIDQATGICGIIRKVQAKKNLPKIRLSNPPVNSGSCWQWQNEYQQWIDYPDEVNEGLRKHLHHTYLAKNGQRYRVDVISMNSRNLTYGTVRPVRKKPFLNQPLPSPSIPKVVNNLNPFQQDDQEETEEEWTPASEDEQSEEGEQSEEDEQSEEESEEDEILTLRFRRRNKSRATKVKMNSGVTFAQVLETLKTRWKKTAIVAKRGNTLIEPSKTPKDLGLKDGDDIDLQLYPP